MEIELARSWKDPQSTAHLTENPVAAVEVGGLDRQVSGSYDMFTLGCCSCHDKCSLE